MLLTNNCLYDTGLLLKLVSLNVEYYNYYRIPFLQFVKKKKVIKGEREEKRKIKKGEEEIDGKKKKKYMRDGKRGLHQLFLR